MKQNIDIEKLFQEKLGNLESPVSPDVWANISSSIGGATGVAGATAVVQAGMSGLMKTIIISGGVVAAGLVTAYIITQGPEENSNTLHNITPNNTEIVVVDDGLVFDQEGDTAIESDRENIANELKNSPLPERIFTPEMVQQVLIEIEESGAEEINLDEIIKSIEEENGVVADESGPGDSQKEPLGDEAVADSEHLEIQPEQVEEKSTVIITGADVNVFTPNGDNINDKWTVTFENTQEVRIQIFNEASNKVYASDEINFSWDGTDMLGNELEKGDYYYYIIGEDLNGLPFIKQGTIVLE